MSRAKIDETWSLGFASRSMKPLRRSRAYREKLDFPTSPSLMMSSPHWICFLTISETAPRTRPAKAASSTDSPLIFAACICFKSAGCGRAPAWVVRIRSVLRFIFSIPPLSSAYTDSEVAAERAKDMRIEKERQEDGQARKGTNEFEGARIKGQGRRKQIFELLRPLHLVHLQVHVPFL